MIEEIHDQFRGQKGSYKKSIDAIKLIQIAKPQLAIISHLGIKMLESDLLTLIRNIQRETKVQTIVAKEGMVIDPKSYSATQRQKRLIV